MQKQKFNETRVDTDFRVGNREFVITESLLTGSAVETCLEELASLRLNIFREYPYLYDGHREDELKYLRLYVDTPDAFVISVNESGEMIGAATGIPLRHEHASMVNPFADTSYPIDELFYVGEVLFYPSYRDRGLGMRLLGRIYEYVRNLGNYRYLTCATVVKQDNHPVCPESYIQIDRFLERTGFVMLPDVTTSFAWKEIDGINCEHPMQFWVKELGL